MKKLLGLIILLFFWSTYSHSADRKPLEDYMWDFDVDVVKQCEPMYDRQENFERCLVTFQKMANNDKKLDKCIAALNEEKFKADGNLSNSSNALLGVLEGISDNMACDF